MRYLDIDKAIKAFEEQHGEESTLLNCYNADWIVSFLESQPTADVQEVRHGRWIGYPSITISQKRRTVQSIIYKCSCCGKSNGRAKSPYCKNCGAKMCGAESEAKIKTVEEKNEHFHKRGFEEISVRTT